MRKKLLFFFALIASIGFLEAQAVFTNKAGAAIDATRGASPNGKYLVGTSLQKTAFLWDVENGTVENLAPGDPGFVGSGYEVTNDGIVVGTFPDSTYMVNVTEYGVTTTHAMPSAGVWKDGKWTSLGLGMYSHDVVYSLSAASGARAVSEDGKIIAGYSSDSIPGVRWRNYPYSWEYQDGKWVGEDWAMPDEVEGGGAIYDLSADGKMASGYIDIGFGPTGAIWKSKDEYILPLNNGEYTNFFQNISPNGKYALCRNNNTIYVYDITNDRFMTVETGHPENQYFFPTGVSDEGMVVGYFNTQPDNGGTNRAIIWTPELGYMEFKDFIPVFIPDLVIDPMLLNRVINDSRGNYMFTYISGDGMVLGGFIENMRSKQPFILRLAGPVNILSYPKNLSADVPVLSRNRVELSWEMNIGEEEESPVSYIIYRNEQELERIDATTTTYTDTESPIGRNSYAVQAVYPDDKMSRLSDKIEAIIVDNYNLPFTEDFSSRDFNTNFWTTEIERGDSRRMFWNIYNNAGVDNTAGGAFNSLTYQDDYSSSLISKPLDAREESDVYLSFLIRHWAPGYEYETPADTVVVEFEDAVTSSIVEVKRIIVEYKMGWTSQMLDLSDLAAGKLFKVRFRICGGNDTNYLKYLLIDDVKVATTMPEGDAIPHDILLRSRDAESVDIAWQSPVSNLYGLTYTQTIKDEDFTRDDKMFIAVHSFDAEELKVYADNGLYLTSISAYISETIENPTVETEIKLAVFVDGERVVDQDVYGFKGNDWNTFRLNNPIELSSVKENIKFGIDVLAYEYGQGVIGVDELDRSVPGKGDVYSTDGGETWMLLSDLPPRYFANRNFCIVGGVSDLASTTTYDTDIVGYEIYRNGEKINNGMLFGQVFNTEKVEGACYTIRAYSVMSGISSESVAKCAENLTITASIDGEGSIDPQGEVLVMVGDDKTFTFTPALDYKLAEVLVDNVNVPEAVENKSYTFENVLEVHTIVAKFVFDGTGIENSEGTQFAVYPNPTTDKVVVNNNGHAIGSIQLYDTTGRLVNAINNIDQNETVVDMTSLVNGIYFLKIDDITVKVVKQ